MTTQQQSIPTVQKVIAIAWPSFLVAGVATVLFFALLDPRDLLHGTTLMHVSRTGVYTIAFFLFWLMCAASSMLTCYFRRHCHDCNPETTQTK